MSRNVIENVIADFYAKKTDDSRQNYLDYQAGLIDMFGNPITSGVSTFDPSVEVIDLGTADREITPGTFSENLSFEDIVNALQNR